MARIRSIKPEFWTSEQVVECSRDARLLFIGLWTFSDDAGIHPASIKRIKMEIFPGDDIDMPTIRGLVDELLANGLLEEYQVDGDGYWQVTGWHHQKIEKPTYKYPQQSPNGRRKVGDSSPPERSGEDRRGEESIPLDEKPQKGSITIQAYLAQCEKDKTLPIPEDDTIFEYAQSIKLPSEFLHICWIEFVERHIDKPKRYKDWRAAFRNCVRGNWYKLWWINGDGDYQLTTTGMQAKKKQEAA